MNLYNLLALFVFESFTDKAAFHFDVLFQCPLTLSKVTQVSVGKLPLLLPQVTIAQSYACGKVTLNYFLAFHKDCTMSCSRFLPLKGCFSLPP